MLSKEYVLHPAHYTLLYIPGGFRIKMGWDGMRLKGGWTRDIFYYNVTRNRRYTFYTEYKSGWDAQGMEWWRA